MLLRLSLSDSFYSERTPIKGAAKNKHRFSRPSFAMACYAFSVPNLGFGSVYSGAGSEPTVNQMAKHLVLKLFNAHIGSAGVGNSAARRDVCPRDLRYQSRKTTRHETSQEPPPPYLKVLMHPFEGGLQLLHVRKWCVLDVTHQLWPSRPIPRRRSSAGQAVMPTTVVVRRWPAR